MDGRRHLLPAAPEVGRRLHVVRAHILADAPLKGVVAEAGREPHLVRVRVRIRVVVRVRVRG